MLEAEMRVTQDKRWQTLWVATRSQERGTE